VTGLNSILLDDTNRVTGLNLSCEMVRGVSFVKMADQQEQ